MLMFTVLLRFYSECLRTGAFVLGFIVFLAFTSFVTKKRDPPEADFASLNPAFGPSLLPGRLPSGRGNETTLRVFLAK